MFSTLLYQPSKSRMLSSTGTSEKWSTISFQRDAAGQSTVASHGSKTSSQSTGSLLAILIQYGRSRSRFSPVIRSIMWNVGRPSSSRAPFSDMVPVRPKPTPTSLMPMPLPLPDRLAACLPDPHRPGSPPTTR